MVSAFAWYMYNIDVHKWDIQAHSQTRMYTHVKLQKDHYPNPNNDRKEETSNMYLGYKLGAVSITMYINSHTSF